MHVSSHTALGELFQVRVLVMIAHLTKDVALRSSSVSPQQCGDGAPGWHRVAIAAPPMGQQR